MVANITFLSFLLFSMCQSIRVAVNMWLNCSFFTLIIIMTAQDIKYCHTYKVFQKKNCTNFMHHNFATLCHKVMRFSAKCSERNCLHDKCQCLNTTIKYSLFCSSQINYLKTKLTAISLKHIRAMNKIRQSI